VSEITEIGDFVREKIKILDKESPKSQAACAKLRRAIGKPPGSTPEIWEVTLEGAPDEWQSCDDEPSPAEWAVHTALTLYAMHRQGKDYSMQSDSISFASATALIIRDDDARLDAIRRRFNAMATAAELTELAYHARSIIQILKAGDIPMNYPRFAEDLFRFQKPRSKDGVRLRWGEEFYRILSFNQKKDDDKE